MDDSKYEPAKYRIRKDNRRNRYFPEKRAGLFGMFWADITADCGYSDAESARECIRREMEWDRADKDSYEYFA